MKLNIKEHRLFDIFLNKQNPTGLIIIKKDVESIKHVKNLFFCPITKTSLNLIRGSYFTRKGLLAYPIIDKVPCLLKENAIVATHFESNFSD